MCFSCMLNENVSCVLVTFNVYCPVWSDNIAVWINKGN